LKVFNKKAFMSVSIKRINIVGYNAERVLKILALVRYKTGVGAAIVITRNQML
jgi:hypothetical protein